MRRPGLTTLLAAGLLALSSPAWGAGERARLKAIKDRKGRS